MCTTGARILYRNIPSLWRLRLSLVLGLLMLAACSTAPPRNINNACAIFSEYDDWFDDASEASRRWGVPVPVLLAIIRQESSFQSDAQPPRSRILWIIPGPRPSSAYGYSQALDGTWDWYLQATGNHGADRDDFEDAVDFVGWYVNETWRRNGVAKNDAYRQYLAYHEGHGGYARGTYRQKPWLLKVARKVSQQADRYRAQLAQCQSQLADRGGLWNLF